MANSSITERLGSDLKFPINGNFEPVAGLATLIQDIQQLLLTSPGERVFRPTWGCGLKAMIWENIDNVVQNGPGAIRTALTTFEPRITVTDVKTQMNRNTGLVMFGIVFYVKNVDTPVNLVFPFRVGTALSAA